MKFISDGCMGPQEVSVEILDKRTKNLFERLIKTGKRFRNTPIVDDDFVAIRNEFDSVLEESARWMEQNK